MSTTLEKLTGARKLLGEVLFDYSGAMDLDPLSRHLLAAVTELDAARRALMEATP